MKIPTSNLFLTETGDTKKIGKVVERILRSRRRALGN